MQHQSISARLKFAFFGKSRLLQFVFACVQARGNESVVSVSPDCSWRILASGISAVSSAPITKQKHSSTEMKFSSENLDILSRKDQ